MGQGLTGEVQGRKVRYLGETGRYNHVIGIRDSGYQEPGKVQVNRCPPGRRQEGGGAEYIGVLWCI